MNSAQKASYLGETAQYKLASGDSKGYFDTLYKQLEYEKKTAVTREDYIPIFERYISELQEAEPEATTDDVVDQLKEANERLEKLEDAISRSPYQGEL